MQDSVEEQTKLQRRFNDPLLRSKVPWLSRKFAEGILEDEDLRAFVWSIAEDFIEKYPPPPDDPDNDELLKFLAAMAVKFLRLFFVNDFLDRLYKP